VSTPADALQEAADALQTLEREHADSAAALDGRRARHREAASQLEELHRRVKAADPDAKDFAKLSGERSTARDREEALRSQLARAEGEHRGLGARVQRAREAHQKAIREEALARIRQSSAELDAALSKFLRTFRPQIEAHYRLLVAENAARATNDPFTPWGLAYPDPGLPLFWEMVHRAFLSALAPGSPEHGSAQRAAQIQGAVAASVMNSRPA
jgi:DNA repair exonuclease SbcCD ATPase subunit